jgi:glycosyltransferase involved in cell wall biosynthesis
MWANTGDAMNKLLKMFFPQTGESKRAVSICAIVAVRNELPYLSVLLPKLAEDGIDVVILDNESTDGSHQLYDEFAGKSIVSVDTIPYGGAFSLADQLIAKQAVISRLHHDWVIHVDADEIFEHRDEGLTLRDAIQSASDRGFNAVDFDEFIFLPEPGEDYVGRNFFTGMRRYYYFRPKANRQNRAWKRAANLSNLEFGGHKLEGANLSIDPVIHVKRHYIALSEPHVQNKYVGRTFARDEVARGWHHNRLDIPAEKLLFPVSDDRLFTLESATSKAFRRDTPATTHYWSWDR